MASKNQITNMPAHNEIVKVSVVMPVYNEERYLREAIDSILSQTFSDFELILLNDGSTDATRQIIDEYEDPRIVPIHQENMGLIATLNKGIQLAKGRYIARMDGDDISLPDRLRVQVEYLEKNPTVEMVAGHFIRINGDGAELDRRYIPLDPQEIRLTLLLEGCKISHPSVMVRTGTLRTLDGYNMDRKHVEDYDLWLRLIYSHRIGAVDEFLLKWRVWPGSVSQQNHRFQERRSRRLRTLAVRREGARYRNRRKLACAVTGLMYAAVYRSFSSYDIGMSNILSEYAQIWIEKKDLDEACDQLVQSLGHNILHWKSLKTLLSLFLPRYHGKIWKILYDIFRDVDNISFPAILKEERSARPRMLFFTVTLPFPITSGSNARTLNLLKYLASGGYDIVLIYSETETASQDQKQELLKYVSCLYRMKTYKPGLLIGGLLHTLLSHCQLILGIQITPPFHKYHFRKMLKECNYEIIFTNYFFGSRWIGAAKRDALRIVDTHDSAFQRAQRKIQLDYYSFKKGIAQALLAIYRRCELHLYDKFDRIIAISPHDYSVFEKSLRSNAKLVQVQPPIDLSHFSPGNETEIIKDTILFIGTGNLANTDAFRFFVTEIFPLIRRELPAAHFSMAGNKPSREQIELANITENVEVLGFQEDLREQYKSAEVVVCPLRIGSRMKVKVIEAAAMGKAVVMTSVSAEGIPMQNGEECVVVDDPEEFAAAVVGLLRSEEDRRTMGSKARTFVERNFDAGLVFRELEDVLMEHFAQSRDMQKSKTD